MKMNYPDKTRDDFLKQIVYLLVTRRKQLGLTQDELNDILGVADRLVGKWECGVRTPTAFHLLCWADALKSEITVSYHANDNIAPKK